LAHLLILPPKGVEPRVNLLVLVPIVVARSSRRSQPASPLPGTATSPCSQSTTVLPTFLVAKIAVAGALCSKGSCHMARPLRMERSLLVNPSPGPGAPPKQPRILASRIRPTAECPRSRNNPRRGVMRPDAEAIDVASNVTTQHQSGEDDSFLPPHVARQQRSKPLAPRKEIGKGLMTGNFGGKPLFSLPNLEKSGNGRCCIRVFAQPPWARFPANVSWGIQG
jgi:hypothetical protein